MCAPGDAGAAMASPQPGLRAGPRWPLLMVARGASTRLRAGSWWRPAHPLDYAPGPQRETASGARSNGMTLTTPTRPGWRRAAARRRHWPAALAGAAAAAAAALVLAWSPVYADDPDFLAVSLGSYDYDDNEGAAEARLEYRSDRRLWIFKPFSGLMLTGDSAVYGYGGVLVDVFFGRRIVLTPSFAGGLYHDGTGKDLGHAVEFRSQIEIAYRFAGRARLGVGLSHISNAGLADRNPGTNALMATYAVPFSSLLGH